MNNVGAELRTSPKSTPSRYLAETTIKRVDRNGNKANSIVTAVVKQFLCVSCDETIFW